MDIFERCLDRMTFHIDTNRINAGGKLENMNKLEKWENDEVITIYMSETAHSEARAGGNQQRSKKATAHIFSISSITTSDERNMFHKIERMLFPDGGKTENQKNDVDIVFNASKYNCILITSDGGSKRQPGGILGNRKKLGALGIRVLTDEEAVELVESEIKKRDEIYRNIASHTGQKLPWWVGKD